jgi:protease-4
MIFALLLLVLLGISMLFNLGSIFGGMVRSSGSGSGKSSGPRLDEVVLEDNDAASKIAVLDISGVIASKAIDGGGFNLVDVIKAQLKHAEEDEKVKAVILKVDSPGGEVLASDDISRALTDFQGDKNHKGKPVVVSMGNLAASGGYYVSAPCRWIVANDLTITGSIGVIMHGYNYRGLMNKVGVVPQTFKSGKFKDMLSPDRNPEEIPPEERAMMQHLIDETYGKFKQVVADGRKGAHELNKKNADPKDQGRALADDWADYADGRVLSGTEAYKLGFVDQLGTFDDAVKRAKTIAGIRDGANLVRYQARFDLSDIFRMFGQSSQAQSRVLKVDLGIETPKLQAGHLYFLSPMFTP